MPPPPPPGPFTQEQEEWISRLLARAMQSNQQHGQQEDSVAREQCDFGEPSNGLGYPRDDEYINSGNTGGHVNTTTTRDDGVNQFKPEVIGFFHPDLPSANGTSDIVHSGKEVIYRDVHAFVDRLKDMTMVYDATAIRTNLVKCLRGRAAEWYSTELPEVQKDGMRIGEGIKHWTDVFIKKFKEPASIALTCLQGTKYTLSDARQQHDPMKYIYEIMRRAKAAGMTTTHQQLTHTYNGVDPELRALLDEPEEETKIDDFIGAVEKKKRVCHESPKDYPRIHNQGRNQEP